MKPKHHCLALVSDAFGGAGGIAQYNRDFFEALARLPLMASIRVFPRNVHASYLELPGVVRQSRASSTRVGYAMAALWAALAHPVDVVFCGHIHLLPLATIVAKLGKAKLIFQAHGIEVWSRPSRLQRWALEHADLVLCVSRYTRGVVLGAAAIAPETLIVLPNTVGDAFTPGDTSESRRMPGLESKQVLLTVGRIDSREQYKGHDRVIKCLPALAEKIDDIRYIIVGSGDDMARLKMLARENGVADRVIFAGELNTAALVDAFRTADLYVMPSTGEGFGIVFLEAMACGTPALGLALTGAMDALADGVLGFAVAESELTVAIERALAVPKPDGTSLATAVTLRFGRDIFEANVKAALERLLGTE